MITWSPDETPTADQLWDAYGDMTPECFANKAKAEPTSKWNILTWFRMLIG